MHLSRLLFATTVILAPCADAQEKDAAPQPGLDMLKTMVFETLKTDPAADRGGMFRQIYGLVGREDLVSPNPQAVTCVALPDDPVAAIVERARATNIVIINEDHAAPYDRYFIGRVLTALRAEGYAIYAAETFMPLRDFGHEGVRVSDGFYINDPVFARAAALAKSLGYKLIAYEQTPDQDTALEAINPEVSRINRRETAQTQNLMNAVFNRTPDAKVLIHVGHSHVWEHKMPGSQGATVWMAERLKASTGRDPLTIDQTMCRSATGASVVATERTKADGTVQPVQVTDIFIGHAPLEFRHGRVAWRQDLGERIVPMPAELAGRAEPVIVEARPEDAAPDIVAADRVFLRPGEILPLLLPPGRYRVEGFTAAGRIEGVAPVVEAR